MKTRSTHFTGPFNLAGRQASLALILLCSLPAGAATRLPDGDLWPLTREEVEQRLFVPGRLCIEPDKDEQTCTMVIKLGPGPAWDEASLQMAGLHYSQPRPGVKAVATFKAKWESSKLCFAMDEAFYKHHTLYDSIIADTDPKDRPLPEKEQAQWRATLLLLEGDASGDLECMRFFWAEGDPEDQIYLKQFKRTREASRFRADTYPVRIVPDGESISLRKRWGD